MIIEIEVNSGIEDEVKLMKTLEDNVGKRASESPVDLSFGENGVIIKVKSSPQIVLIGKVDNYEKEIDDLGSESYSEEEINEYAESGIDYYPDGEIDLPFGINMSWDAVYNVRTDDYEEYPVFSLTSALEAFGITDVIEHVNDNWTFDKIDFFEIIDNDKNGIVTALVDIDIV